MIIVVIENTNGIRDFAPTKPGYDKDGNEIKYHSWDKLGEAEKFLSFIENELFLFIDENYRTIKKIAPTELIWKFDCLANEDHGSQATIALINGKRFIYEGWAYDRFHLVGYDYVPK